MDTLTDTTAMAFLMTSVHNTTFSSHLHHSRDMWLVGDMMIKAAVTSFALAMMTNIRNKLSEWQSFLSWASFLGLFRRYCCCRRQWKHTIVIKSDSVAIPGKKYINLNAGNELMIDAILARHSPNKEKTMELINNISDAAKPQRHLHLEAAIQYLPKCTFTIDDMKFDYEFVAKFSPGQDGSSPSLRTTKIMTVFSKNVKTTQATLAAWRNAEIDRRFPPHVARTESRYYYISGNMDEKEDDAFLFSYYPFQSCKTFRSIFFKQKQLLVQTLDHFQNRTGPWAPELERSHKLIILLHGKPGGGKSSCLKAIAHHTNRDIIAPALDKIRNDMQLTGLFMDPSLMMKPESKRASPSWNTIEIHKRMLIFEDMDCGSFAQVIAPRHSKDTTTTTITTAATTSLTDAFVQALTQKAQDHKQSASKTGPTLSGLLNVMDGVLVPQGLIVVITTNYIDKFDDAIFRPGRVDLCIRMEEMQDPEINEYLRFMYPKQHTIVHTGLKARMPAEVQEICQQTTCYEDLLLKLKL